MAFVSVAGGHSGVFGRTPSLQGRSVCARTHVRMQGATGGTGGAPMPPSDGNGNSFMASLRSQLQKSLDLPAVEVQETECLYCSGSGKCACSWCKGNGTRMETEMKSNEALQEDIARMMKGEDVKMPGEIPVVCSACKGSCTLPCRYCRGLGRASYGFSSAKESP